jgi:hypothetical protein
MLRSFQNIANPTNTLPLTPKYDKNISAKKVDYTKKPDDSLKTKAPGYNFINFWIQNAEGRLSDYQKVVSSFEREESFYPFTAWSSLVLGRDRFLFTLLSIQRKEKSNANSYFLKTSS